MSTNDMMRARLKNNRPSRRKRARPPKQRTALGQDFTSANLGYTLSLQQCNDCDARQYPPRDICSNCLSDSLIWRNSPTGGHIVSAVNLHHSLWEFFKRKVELAPWPIASIRLDCGPIVFAHVDPNSLLSSDGNCPAIGTAVQVFSHRDCSLNSVLIAVAASLPIDKVTARGEIARTIGLTEPAIRAEGI